MSWAYRYIKCSRIKGAGRSSRGNLSRHDHSTLRQVFGLFLISITTQITIHRFSPPSRPNDKYIHDYDIVGAGQRQGYHFIVSGLALVVLVG